jgi:hypothetical protein
VVLAALEELAAAGRGLLIGDGGPDGESSPAPSPIVPDGNPPSPLSLGAPAIASSDADSDGKFGLTDEEITRPTRRILADWLHGRIPMLGSNWSTRATLLLEAEAIQQAKFRSVKIG